VRAGVGASEVGKTFITIIFTQVGSAPALHFSLPRVLDTAWTSDSKNAAQVRTIVLNSPIFALPGASVHALRWHSPSYSDLLVMAPSEQFGATGFIYSGANITGFNFTPIEQ